MARTTHATANVSLEEEPRREPTSMASDALMVREKGCPSKGEAMEEVDDGKDVFHSVEDLLSVGPGTL